jgi:hypothetical protein
VALYINIFIYCVIYYYGASKEFNLSTSCGVIRQPLHTKMRQLFYVKKSVVVELPCVQVIYGPLQYLDFIIISAGHKERLLLVEIHAAHRSVVFVKLLQEGAHPVVPQLHTP